MSRSPKSTTPAPVVLNGLAAVQIRELLDGKKVTAKAVVAFLTEKEQKSGLRAPSKKLLEELTGEAKPAAAKAGEKPVAKPAAKAGEKPAAKPAAKAGEAKAAPTPEPAKDDLAALVAAVAALTERVAALEAKRAPAAKVSPAKSRKTAAK